MQLFDGEGFEKLMLNNFIVLYLFKSVSLCCLIYQ